MGRKELTLQRACEVEINNIFNHEGDREISAETSMLGVVCFSGSCSLKVEFLPSSRVVGWRWEMESVGSIHVFPLLGSVLCCVRSHKQ